MTEHSDHDDVGRSASAAATKATDESSEPRPDGDASTRARLAVLWSFARPYLGVLAVGFVLSLMVSAMTLTSPMVTRWILDALADGGSLRDPVLLLVGLLVIGAAVGWFQWVLLGKLAEDIVYDARDRMLRRYLGARVFSLLERSPGELVTRVTSDTVLLNQAASNSVIGLINGTIVLVGSLILMAWLDWFLLLTTLGAVVVVGLVFIWLMPKIAKVEERSQAVLSDLGTDLEGTVRAIKTVKSSRAEARRLASLRHHVGESRRWSLKSVRIQAAAWSVAGVGIDGAVIIVLAVGAARVATGQISVATLVAFLLYVWGLMGPVTELTQNLTTLQSGIAAAGRIIDIERLPTEDPSAIPTLAPAGPRASTAGSETNSMKQRSKVPNKAVEVADDRGEPETPVIELSAVTARYVADAPAAVDRVDLTIPRRGHVALVGPSGAGKTTLFSLLLRFLEPEAGELRLFGIPYRQLTHETVRSTFAYVEQETPVVPGTIGDNLRFSAPDATDEAIAEVLRRLQLDEKIASLSDGLDTPLTDTNVSGGQRQRLSLARAMLADPDVLLLDEATAQVDGITEAAVQQVIAERSQTGAVVTIAHRLSTVLDADQIVVMNAGEIVARGTHHELLTGSTLYRDLVHALRIEHVEEAGKSPS